MIKLGFGRCNFDNGPFRLPQVIGQPWQQVFGCRQQDEAIHGLVRQFTDGVGFLLQIQGMMGQMQAVTGFLQTHRKFRTEFARKMDFE